MKIGLFGGTFDPIHLGHVDMIVQLRNAMHLDSVVFVPAYISPFKQNAHVTAYEHRLQMARLAIDGQADFEVSDFESRSEKPSYTFYTAEHFKSCYPDDELYFIMGVDAFNDIEKWFRWEDLLDMIHVVVVDRPHKKMSVSPEVHRVLHQSACHVYYLPLHTLPISSTMIRERLKIHESVQGLLDDRVWDYIKENHLYECDENGLSGDHTKKFER